MTDGLIIKGIAGFYYVKTDSGVFECKARGIFKKDGVTPMVGDMVTIETSEGGGAVVRTIHERKNEFVRPPVSNVDCFIVVIAAARPTPNLMITDRFLIAAEKNGARALICINKIDVAEEEKIRGIERVYENLYPVARVSGRTGMGIDELRSMMKEGKYALAGPSGTGKSTLLNAIQPSANVETGEISRKTARGRHTTRHTEIFETSFGAMLFDTPGFTSFDVPEVESEELQHLYPEIAARYGKCRYRNCAHIKEAGCAVLDAVSAGDIHRDRYESYKEIYKEIVENRR